MDELINRTLGGYQIIEQIGIGGMATVYKAYQANMDRYVALKVLPRQLAEDPNFLARFEQEARTIARLENKNILPVYDYGTQDGYTYLVMRYVGHGTLKDLTTKGPLPLPTTVDFLEQIAEALQYAHDNGVIHRDVKTSNVLIDEHQQCYLTDFGIAKLAASSAHFTASGALIGTPAYMSPEQCSGMAIDHRSDLYSLGIVLYEMLTGVVPYQAETPVAIVLMHMQSPLPSPRQNNPNIPEAVEQVVFRALAKSPDDRFQSARDFAQALRQAMENATGAATLSMPRSSAEPAPSGGITVSAHVATPTQLSAPTAPDMRTYTLRLTRKRVLLATLALLVTLVVLGALSDRHKEQQTTGENTATAVAAGAFTTPEAPTTLPVISTMTHTPASGVAETLEPPAATAHALTTVPTRVSSPTVVPPTESSMTDMVTEQQDEFTLDVFTSTRGQDDMQRQIAVTRGGIWISSGGGLEFWTRDGESTTYNSADGLLFNHVQKLAVDRQGGLWAMGGEAPGVMHLSLTADGAIETIEAFTSENSDLRSDFVWTMYADRDEVLFGTYETLIEAWNASQGWHAPDFPTFETALETVGDRVWALVRTRDGTLWAGGPVGAARLDVQTGDWVQLEPPPQVQGWDYDTLAYTRFFPDRADDSLWVFGYAEPDWRPFVARLVYEEDAAMPWHWAELPFDLPEDVRDMARAADGTLWVVLYDKVLRFAPDGKLAVFTRDDGLPGEVFLHIALDKDDAVWLTSDIGLAFFDGERWDAYLSDMAVPFHDAVAVAEDEDGTFWFASPYGDLMALYDETWWEVVSTFDLQIFDMCMANGVLWLATDQGLLRWEEGIVRRYTTANGLTDNVVLTVRADPQDETWLWVGTVNGLNVLNTETDEIHTWAYKEGELPAPAVTLLYADWHGRLWVGVGGAPWEDMAYAPSLLLRGRPQNDADPTSFDWIPMAELGEPFAEEEGVLLSLGVDRKGTLWLGTDVMLHRYDGQTWTPYTEDVDQQAPMYTPITAIYAAAERVLVGTEHEGLFFYDGERWHTLGMNGTGSPTIHRITRTEDGSLWILSADSITRLRGDIRSFAEKE